MGVAGGAVSASRGEVPALLPAVLLTSDLDASREAKPDVGEHRAVPRCSAAKDAAALVISSRGRDIAGRPDTA